MRKIGELSPEKAARGFSRILEMHGIEHQISPNGTGGQEIWIVEEEHLGDARALLERFFANPDSPELQPPPETAARREKERKTQAGPRFRSINARTQIFHGMATSGKSTATWVLIAISTLAFLASLTGQDGVLALLRYAAPGDRGFLSIRSLEIWRLVTPIFLHFGFLHFIFNMVWLRDLGAQVEGHAGTTFLAVFVLFTAALSNTAQYAVTGPAFGGMSGVVYALLGYVWMRSRYDPGSGFALADTTAIMMLVWYFLCVFGIVGRVANLVHGAGLLAGMIWGLWLPTKRRGRLPFRWSDKSDRWVLAVLVTALPLAFFAELF